MYMISESCRTGDYNKHVKCIMVEKLGVRIQGKFGENPEMAKHTGSKRTHRKLIVFGLLFDPPPL